MKAELEELAVMRTELEEQEERYTAWATARKLTPARSVRLLRPTRPGDHHRIWKSEDGEIVVTAEPYTSNLHDELTRTLAWAEHHDYRIVSITSESPYFPGKTTLIVLKPVKTRPWH